MEHQDFYSHAPYGTWPGFPPVHWSPCRFLLTRPLRDVTNEYSKIVGNNIFLLTRPLRDVTNEILALSGETGISTHTPLTGRDHRPVITDEQVFDFYSHAPYGTWRDFKRFAAMVDISTHTPLTGRDPCVLRQHRPSRYISTHTPLTGRDCYILYLCNGTFPHIGTDLFLLISFIWYRIYNLFIIMFFQANLKWFLNHHTFATFK